MVRFLFSLSVFLLLFLNGCSPKGLDKDSATNDSIKKYLDLAADDSLDFEHRLKYNNKAYSFIDIRKNDSLSRSYLYEINLSLSSLGEISLFRQKSIILINKSSSADDLIGMSRGYLCLGYSYLMDSKNELAIKYFFKAKKGFASKKLYDDELNVMRWIATTQSYANDFLGSINTSLEIIKKSKQYNRTYEFNGAYLNIGNNFSYLKNERKAIYYYKKINYSKDNYNSILALKGNLASSYIQLKEYGKAYNLLKDLPKNPKFKIQKTKSIGIINSLLGLYYLKINQPKQAYFFLKQADEIFRAIKALNGENYNQIYFSEYYAEIKDTSNAIKAAQKAVILSKSYKNPLDILISLSQILKVDKKKSFLYAQEYIRINDSMQTSERRFRDKFAEIRYETNQISQEKESAIKQRWVLSASSIIIILLVLIILVITSQNSKEKEIKLLKGQQKANEEIYNLMLMQNDREEEARRSEKIRIARELHDGVMNRLSSTRLNLDILKYNKDDQTITKCLPYIEELYFIEQEIRNISHDLNIEAFNNSNSFVGLLNNLISKLNEISSTDYKLEMNSAISWNTISSNIKINIYRIIQEACSNINKFAKAEKATISFALDDNNICLSIMDDGEGFDPETKSDGIGLKNIKQRVELLHGDLFIQSVKNKSTSINIAIPIE